MCIKYKNRHTVFNKCLLYIFLMQIFFLNLCVLCFVKFCLILCFVCGYYFLLCCLLSEGRPCGVNFLKVSMLNLNNAL